jgi:hypothetical protein
MLMFSMRDSNSAAESKSPAGQASQNTSSTRSDSRRRNVRLSRARIAVESSEEPGRCGSGALSSAPGARLGLRRKKAIAFPYPRD